MLENTRDISDPNNNHVNISKKWLESTTQPAGEMSCAFPICGGTTSSSMDTEHRKFHHGSEPTWSSSLSTDIEYIKDIIGSSCKSLHSGARYNLFANKGHGSRNFEARIFFFNKTVSIMPEKHRFQAPLLHHRIVPAALFANLPV